METGKRKKIVYTLFALAVIFGFYNLYIGFDKNNAKLAPVSQQQLAPQIVMPAKTIDIEQYSTLNWGRDPFYWAKKGNIPVVSDKVQIGWILNGILFNKQTPSAVINKKIVSIGDKINGAKIIDISKTEVTLEKEDSEIFTLQITKDKS